MRKRILVVGLAFLLFTGPSAVDAWLSLIERFRGSGAKMTVNLGSFRDVYSLLFPLLGFLILLWGIWWTRPKSTPPTEVELGSQPVTAISRRGRSTFVHSENPGAKITGVENKLGELNVRGNEQGLDEEYKGFKEHKERSRLDLIGGAGSAWLDYRLEEIQIRIAQAHGEPFLNVGVSVMNGSGYVIGITDAKLSITLDADPLVLASTLETSKPIVFYIHRIAHLVWTQPVGGPTKSRLEHAVQTCTSVTWKVGVTLEGTIQETSEKVVIPLGNKERLVIPMLS